MSFRLVPKSVTLNDLERRMAVTLRYFTEFGKHTCTLLSRLKFSAMFLRRVIRW